MRTCKCKAWQSYEYSTTILAILVSSMQGSIVVYMQAAHAQRVHMALGEVFGEEANLNAVVELMLDITESTVAFCWELGAGKLPAAI